MLYTHKCMINNVPSYKTSASIVPVSVAKCTMFHVCSANVDNILAISHNLSVDR